MVSRASLGTAVLELETDNSKLNKGLDTGHSSVKGFAEAGAVAIAGLGVAMGGVAAGLVSAASDVSESWNKVQVVFGDNAGAVDQFSRDAAKSMGMSRGAALEAAGTFGALFTAMGLGQQPT